MPTIHLYIQISIWIHGAMMVHWCPHAISGHMRCCCCYSSCLTHICYFLHTEMSVLFAGQKLFVFSEANEFASIWNIWANILTHSPRQSGSQSLTQSPMQVAHQPNGQPHSATLSGRHRLPSKYLSSLLFVTVAIEDEKNLNKRKKTVEQRKDKILHDHMRCRLMDFVALVAV